MKATIIGGGNIGMALAEGLLQAKVCQPEDIMITRRTATALDALQHRGFRTTVSNADAIKGADAIFICVLPQQLDAALSELKSTIDLEKQLVVS
ncbi:MAG: pyrroline-5-carboxylate reductase, partial [Chitinophagaceae bacterium]